MPEMVNDYKIGSVVVKFMLVATIAGVFVVLSGSLLLGYEQCIHTLLSLFNKKEKKDFVFAIASRNLFINLQIYLVVLLIFCASLLWFLWEKLERGLVFLKGAVAAIPKECLSFYRSMTQAERSFAGCFLIVLILYRSYLMFMLPVNSDELWMFQSYGKNNPLLSFFWYPLPSNHVLQTFVSRIFLYFLPYSIESMRVPVVLTGIVVVVLYCIIADTFIRNKKITLMSAMLFTASAGVNTSLVYARGYAFILFFTLLLMFFLLEIIRGNKNASGNYVMVYLSIVAGFISVFSFAYNFVTVLVFFILYVVAKQRYYEAGKLIMVSLLSILTVLILYGPIIIVNGWNAVFIPSHSSEYLNTVLKDHIRIKIIDWFIGIHEVAPVIMFLFALLPIVVWLVRKDGFSRMLLALSVFAMLVPWVIMFAHKVYPFGRMLNYIWIFVSIDVGLLLSSLKIRVYGWMLLIVLVLSIGINEWVLKKGVFGKDIATGLHSEKIAEKLMEDNRKNVYFENSHYSMMAEYYYAKSGKPITFSYAKNDAVDAIVLSESTTPDAWMLDKYKLTYQDNKIRIYTP